MPSPFLNLFNRSPPKPTVPTVPKRASWANHCLDSDLVLDLDDEGDFVSDTKVQCKSYCQDPALATTRGHEQVKQSGDLFMKNIFCSCTAYPLHRPRDHQQTP